MYGLSTFPLVMLLAAPGQIGFEAEEPGFQILLRVGLLTHLGRPAERASPSAQQRGGPSLRTCRWVLTVGCKPGDAIALVLEDAETLPTAVLALIAEFVIVAEMFCR